MMDLLWPIRMRHALIGDTTGRDLSKGVTKDELCSVTSHIPQSWRAALGSFGTTAAHGIPV